MKVGLSRVYALQSGSTVHIGLGRLVIALVLVASAASASDRPLHLKNRTFTPPTAPAAMWRHRVRGGREHYLVQFDGPVDAAKRQALAAAGARVLHAVPENAVAVVAPAGFDGASIPGVRWVGQLEAADKLSRQSTGDLAAARPQHAFSVVQFFPDTVRATVAAAIASAGTAPLSVPMLPAYAAVVRTEPSALRSLAARDDVAWIYPASDRLVSGAAAPMCQAVADALAVADFAEGGEGWDGPGQGPAQLGYILSTPSPDLPAATEANELRRAMAEWSRYVALDWSPSASPTAPKTVNILWAAGDHGDGFAFTGSTLAHTFYPAPPGVEPLAGDLHFNDAFTWGVDASGDYDIFSVALHELGHALGLPHSSDPTSVMYPTYQGVITGLSQADITAIRQLYATRSDPGLPTGWTTAQVGLAAPASMVTAAAGGVMTLEGSGTDVWGTADSFTFAARPLTGDGDIVARVDSIAAVQRWTKAGVMIRDGNSPSAAHAFVLVSGSKGLAFQRRVVAGGISTSNEGIPGAAPYWVKLSRRGNLFEAYAAADGAPWALIGRDTIVMSETVEAGLALTAHLEGAVAAATFSAVTIAEQPRWTSQDIGAVPVAGSFLNSVSQMELTGSGADVWGTADAFRFAWLPMTGDGEIVARVRSVSYAHAWSKAGVMIRSGLTPGAAQAFMFVSAGKGYAFQRRPVAEGISYSSAGGTGTAPAWVRLVRRGDLFTAYLSLDGDSWQMIGTETIPMRATVYAGLAVTSHSLTAASKAVFDFVEIH